MSRIKFTKQCGVEGVIYNDGDIVDESLIAEGSRQSLIRLGVCEPASGEVPPVIDGPGPSRVTEVDTPAPAPGAPEPAQVPKPSDADAPADGQTNSGSVEQSTNSTEPTTEPPGVDPATKPSDADAPADGQTNSGKKGKK